MQLPFDRPPPGLLAIPAPTGPFRPHRPLQVPPVLRINSESCRIHHVFRLHVRRAKSDELLLKKRKKRKLHFMQFWAGSFQEDYRIEVVVLNSFIKKYIGYKCICSFQVSFGPPNYPNIGQHILYARHYNLWFVYFLPTLRSPKTGRFFLKFWRYVWLVFKSGL